MGIKFHKDLLVKTTSSTMLGFSLLSSAALYTGSAHAGLAIQTLYGIGSGDLTKVDVDGNNSRDSFETSKVSVAAHVDPFQSLPITLGLFYSTFNAASELPEGDFEQLRGFDYGWDILTWTRVHGLGLSLRYGQALGGQYQVYEKDFDGDLKSETFQIKNSYVGIGLAIPMSQKFGALLEYRQVIESSFSDQKSSADRKAAPVGFDGGMIFLGMEISV